MGRKIKLGIIGTGLAAKNLHLPALKQLTDKFRITAVCNHTERKAKEFSKLIGGVKYYLNYNELLNDKNVEAVDITLPINLNYSIAVDSLLAGKHIFLEKPLAGSMIEAKKILKYEKQLRLKTLLAENFRYRKVYNSLNTLLKKKTIGKVYAAQWNVFYRVTTNKDYGATKWRQKPKYVGAFILDAGVHNIAALRMLFGEVKSVAAFTKSVNPKIGKPDTVSMQINFSSGINVIFNMFFTVKHHWENKLLVFGDKGSIETNDDTISIKLNDKKPKTIDASDSGGFKEEFLDFYDSIIKNKNVRSTFFEGYKDMEVVFAAFKSAETNKVIKLK